MADEDKKTDDSPEKGNCEFISSTEDLAEGSALAEMEGIGDGTGLLQMESSAHGSSMAYAENREHEDHHAEDVDQTDNGTKECACTCNRGKKIFIAIIVGIVIAAVVVAIALAKR